MKKSLTLVAGCLFTLFALSHSILICPHTAFPQSEKEDTAKLIEGAKKEGKMVWYAAVGGSDSDRLLKGFELRYPFIKAECYRVGAEKLLTKILAEVRADKHLFDVADNGVLEGETLAKKGIFAKYISPQWKFYPEEHRHPEGYWTGIYSNKVVIAYNTHLVSPKGVPKTYEDLLDPQWKGKIGMDTKAYYEFAVMLKIMGGGEKGLRYMNKLSEQNIQFRTGRSLILTLMAAGEISIGIALYNHSVEELKGKGAPLEWAALEPVIDKTHPFGIYSRAPHPNAAKLFVEFVLSKEGQEILASCYRIPTRIDVDAIVPRLKCKDKRMFPLDLSVVENFESYVKLYQNVLMKK